MRYITGPVDPKPAPHGSLGVWRVGSGSANRLSKSRGSGRVGSGGFQYLTGRVRSGEEILQSRGSGRVGSRRLEFLAGRVGSADPTGPDPTRPARFDLTREKSWNNSRDFVVGRSVGQYDNP